LIISNLSLGAIFHVILFFPPEYPAKSPSAEFVPKAFQPVGGATMEGTKGTKVCLSIFSDFAFIHKEWANEKGTGWSPSYTVQTVLLNLLSFLLEVSENSSWYQDRMDNNVKVSYIGYI
jgi:ubiquitin-protein ligase